MMLKEPWFGLLFDDLCITLRLQLGVFADISFGRSEIHPLNLYG